MRNSALSNSNSAAAAKDRQAEIRQILEILHKWGIHTLGQFAALDKEQIAARLGPAAVRLWERANGRSNRLLKLVQPQELFEESFEFEREIETAQPLLFMLRRFLEQLAARLSAIYLVAKELTLHITFANPPQDGSAEADKKIYERNFKLPQPTNDVDLLFRMLQTHLENFKSEHPIVAVALAAQPIKPISQPQMLSGFEMALRNPQQFYETLGRLAALLGTDRVGTPVLEETHRPDAFRMERFAWSFKDHPSSSPSPPHREKGPPLPEGEDEGEGHRCLGTASGFRIVLRRFRPAPPASVLLDEDAPAHVRSAEVGGKVVDQGGPYFLSGNWWDEKSWARAEWDLQLEQGELLRVHESERSWKIDGIYD